MDFSLNDHQKLVRDTVRQFMEAEVRPSVKQRDREERFPAEEIRKLAELGCCGMMIPEEWGGPGLDTLSYVLMLEEVARVDAAMATSLSVTNSAVQVPLTKFGTELQKKKYLRRLATGEILGSFCLTEPAAGSDAAGIQARAVAVERTGSGLGARTSPGPGLAPASWGGAPLGTPGGDVYRLNGTKTWYRTGTLPGCSLCLRRPIRTRAAKASPRFWLSRGSRGSRLGGMKTRWGSAARLPSRFC
jgi:alkylation response protein AidB-like acyl-CoA dehydrogenase